MKPTRPRAFTPQQEKPLQREALEPQLESNACLLQLEKACVQQQTTQHCQKLIIYLFFKNHKQPVDNVKLGEWGVQMDSLVIFLMQVQAK